MSDIKQEVGVGVEIEPGIIVENDVGIEPGQLLTSQAELFGEDVLKEISSFLVSEIDAVEDSETESFMERIKKWRRQSNAEPEESVKNYPWPKAANTCPPLAGIKVNAVSGKVQESFSKRKPFWDTRTEVESKKDQAAVAEKYLNLIAMSPDHMNVIGENESAIHDLVLNGTQVIALPWIKEVRGFKRIDRSTGKVVEVVTTGRDSVYFQPIDIADIVIRPIWKDMQNCPWFAWKKQFYWHELKTKETLGIFENIDIIAGSIKDEFTLLEEDTNEMLRITPDPSKTGIYEIYECYMRYDIDGDGIEEEIIIWLEPKSGIIIRYELNSLGVRPFVRLPWLDTNKTFYAQGVGAQLEYLQEEATAYHNIRLNSIQLSSYQMLAHQKGSGLGKSEKIGPAKLVQTNGSPKDVLMPFAFPDTSGTTYAAENLVKMYADQYSGVSDNSIGQYDPIVGSRASGVGMNMLAGQSVGQLHSRMEGLENAYGLIGKIAMMQILYNKDSVDMGLLPESDRPIMEQLLETPPEEILRDFSFTITLTDADKTEDAKKQSLLTLVQLYTMYGQQAMQNLMQIGDTKNQISPEVKDISMTFYVGWTKLMEKVLTSFGEEDVYDFIPYVKDMEYMRKKLIEFKEQNLAEVIRSEGSQTNGLSGGVGQPLGGGMQESLGGVGGAIGAGDGALGSVSGQGAGVEIPSTGSQVAPGTEF